MYHNMKKVELHVHLDGSVRPSLIADWSGKKMKEVCKAMQVDKACTDLNSYLEKFDLPLQYLQSRENLTRVTRELVEDLKRDHVIYAEIRFAPILHTKEGLSVHEVVDAVLAGLEEEGIYCQFILCMMRGFSEEENRKVLEAAYFYLHHGVCALDLAGAEGLYSNELYVDLLNDAKKMGIPFTIHAGEAAGKESIYSAIRLGAQRIGHGIHIEEDEELIRLIKEKNILLEICPTSNVQTRAVESIEAHPIYSYYKKQLPLSVNTDNRCVSDTTLNQELVLLSQVFPFSLEDFKIMQQQALEHAFLGEDIKMKLMQELRR